MIRIAAISVFMCAALGAFAQAAECGAAATQVELNTCAAEAYARADEDLNAAYRVAMTAAKTMGTGVAEALRDAQRKWIPFRDATCDAEGAMYEGGSIRPLIVANCLERLTRARTEDLRAVYEMN